MARLFISHSNKDDVAAIAFKQWLCRNGWAAEDVFLDLDDLGAGERWKEALHKAAARCEAVILLASPDSLTSPECLAEVRKAEDFGKEIIVVLLHDVRFDDRRLHSFKDRQFVHLEAEPQTHTETVAHRGESHDLRFNAQALASVKEYLVKRGIAPEHFPWPPKDKPNAEPFPGLTAFAEEDAGIFFGRDADIVRGLDKLRILRRNRRPRLLVIQAASGAGKSSFLRAGLWPRLKRDPDFAPLAILRPAQGILTGPDGIGRALAPIITRPGTPISPGDIHAALTARELSSSGEAFHGLMMSAATQAHQARQIGDRSGRPPALVLAIDQAEELFAAEDANESQRFLELLASLMRVVPERPEQFVLMTIRADSADRLLQAIDSHGLEVPETLSLLPLPATSYRDVILKPIEIASRRGDKTTVAPDLADRLANDATGADALPLLAFTLSRLYHDYSAGGSLTLEHYQTMGGIGGSIDKALKQALTNSGAGGGTANLRSLIIPHLATWDRDTEAAKRLVARTTSVLGGVRALLVPLAEALVEARLLTRSTMGDEPTLEVAHEALLRREPVAIWLQEDREFLTFRDEAEHSARRWQTMKRPDKALLTGLDLARAEEWLPKRPDDLSPEVKAFIQSSIGRERAEREKRLKFQQRVSIGAVIAALVMTVVGVTAWVKWDEASAERDKATVAESRAKVERDNALRSNFLFLVGQAKTAPKSLDSDESTEAAEKNRIEIATLLLMEALEQTTLMQSHLVEDAIAFDAQRRLVDHLISLPGNGVELEPHGLPSEPSPKLIFQPAGNRLVGLHPNGVVLWDTATGKRIVLHDFRPTVYEQYGYRVQFSPDGRKIVIEGNPKYAAFTGSSTLRLLDAETGDNIQLEGLDQHSTRASFAGFSADSARFAANGVDELIVFDAASGKRRLTAANLTAGWGSVSRPLSSDGSQVIAYARVEGRKEALEARVLDVASGKQVASHVFDTWIHGLAHYGPDAVPIAVGLQEDSVVIARLNGSPPIQFRERPRRTLAIDKFGKRLSVFLKDGRVVLLDATTATEIRTVGKERTILSMDEALRRPPLGFSQDGQYGVSFKAEGTALWHSTGGEEIAMFRGFVSDDFFSVSDNQYLHVHQGPRDPQRPWDPGKGYFLDMRSGKFSPAPGARTHASSLLQNNKFIMVTEGDLGGGRDNVIHTMPISILDDTHALLSYAKGIVERCLRPVEREKLFLASEPPHWCVEMKKKPYDDPEWKQWKTLLRAREKQNDESRSGNDR